MRKIVLTCILIIHMCIIFGFSMKPAEVSGTQSKKFTVSVLNVLPVVSEKSPGEKLEIAENIDFYIRKCAHFSIYTVLGFIAFFAFFSYDKIKNGRYKYMYILIFCLLYAVSDEIHQYFVPGRACRVFDVTIDFLGSLCGVYIASLLSKFLGGRFSFFV